MSTLQHSIDVDSESAINVNGGGAAVGGGGPDVKMSTLQHFIDVDSESAINGGAAAAVAGSDVKMSTLQHSVDAKDRGGGAVGDNPDAKMSTLQQSNDVDLESGIKGKDGGGDGSGEIVEKKEKDERRESNVSDCSVDLESGVTLHLATMAKDCRICHLSMDATNQDSEIPMELGCSCKDDLAAAHKQCAEAWFKIKGNKTCEICGSIAQNVAGVNEAEVMEQWSETHDATAAATATAHAPLSQSRRFWQGHRLLNFLLACTVFAFVISWLFHFNVPS